ncbi:MAG TPA: AbrB/MazE/SpoVT family DNA-binding domain-containing protein [Pseudonocardiaceae bacterium]|nr:AbrB/MazE/SpoVT family DNA-binding domain-containing protein [Pseudonocardiaceae bacterium]
MARVDSSGRVTDRSITTALHWHPGDRLTITAAVGAILVGRSYDGLTLLAVKSCITIPALLRRRHHIHTGDRVLLAADPGSDQLTIYPLATLHHALTGGDPR